MVGLEGGEGTRFSLQDPRSWECQPAVTPCPSSSRPTSGSSRTSPVLSTDTEPTSSRASRDTSTSRDTLLRGLGPEPQDTPSNSAKEQPFLGGLSCTSPGPLLQAHQGLRLPYLTQVTMSSSLKLISIPHSPSFPPATGRFLVSFLNS